ncbi:MAG: hypothetical protein KDC84_12710 [Crocinitomicaceae bacterium]|nr:hypothetical protein [Crocinitomicaceae bacterium]
MNKLSFLLVFGFLFFASASYSQYTREEGDSTKVAEEDKKEEKKADKKDNRESPLKNISVGGNFGFWMTSSGGSLYLGPRIGYKVTEWFRPGILINYQYRWYKYGSVNWSDNVIGGGVFAHFILFKRILLGAEWEILNTTAYPGGLAEPFRTNVNVLLVGAGYNQPIGNAGYFMIGFMFDVLNHPYSPYRSQYLIRGSNGTIPLIMRMGFGFGF